MCVRIAARMSAEQEGADDTRALAEFQFQRTTRQEVVYIPRSSFQLSHHAEDSRTLQQALSETFHAATTAPFSALPFSPMV